MDEEQRLSRMEISIAESTSKELQMEMELTNGRMDLYMSETLLKA